jgi:hypothetical protein
MGMFSGSEDKRPAYLNIGNVALLELLLKMATNLIESSLTEEVGITVSPGWFDLDKRCARPSWAAVSKNLKTV